MRLDAPAAQRPGPHRDPLAHREGQREPAVVVGVLADQVDPTGREGGDLGAHVRPSVAVCRSRCCEDAPMAFWSTPHRSPPAPERSSSPWPPSPPCARPIARPGPPSRPCRRPAGRCSCTPGSRTRCRRSPSSTRHWISVGGGRAVAEHRGNVIYLVMSVRNVGAGHRRCSRAGRRVRRSLRGRRATRPRGRRAPLSRDLYVPAGDIGIWQGALRDPDHEQHGALRDVIDAPSSRSRSSCSTPTTSAGSARSRASRSRPRATRAGWPRSAATSTSTVRARAEPGRAPALGQRFTNRRRERLDVLLGGVP